MAKGDIYYLIDNSNNYEVAKIVLTDDYMTGDCWVPYSWNYDGTACDYHYFAGLYCKWDSCTHWWFRGEDYDPENPEIKESDIDGYYHICGDYCFKDHIRTMCFVWKVAAMALIKQHKDSPNLTPDIARYYLRDEKIKALMDLMLDGYTIKFEEKEK